jgi:hypothetical protein
MEGQTMQTLTLPHPPPTEQLSELLARQPAPADHGPTVCSCGHHGALLDGRCFPCNGYEPKARA